MNVREATLDDAGAIARVHVQTWQVAYRDLIPSDYLDALSVDQRGQVWSGILAALDPMQPNWVCELEGDVVGFASAGASRDEGAGDGVGELFGIYVLPAFQSAGMGRGLMRVAVAWLAARFKLATLWVLEGNAPTIRFSERAGWRFDGTKRDDARGSFVLKELRYRIEFEAANG